MSSELVINSTPKGERIALLENKQLVECHFEHQGSHFNVGDIYLGTIRKIVPGLNAAFIDIGYEKDAFLHYHDLGPQIRSLNKFTKLVLSGKNVSPRLNNFKLEADIHKLGKINQVLSRNQKILVQVVKEPISTKGPRLSCQLSIPGRYLVLVPFSNVVNVSRRIDDNKEKQRLSKLIKSIKPENFGVIVRTVAQGKDVAELDKDLRSLVEKWTNGIEALKKAKPRDKVIGEIDRASSILRDMLNESFDNIVVDDKKMAEEIKTYIKSFAPEKEKIVKQHNNKTKLFENYGIEKQLKILFGKNVSLPSGGSLIIEHTEALHVIDVNSGNVSSGEKDQEQTALKVNLEAVPELARQLRLRDIGGIIVVDFIDMKKPENRKKVYEKMKEEMKKDRSKSVILPLTKFGLMQITRQRIRPELNISTQEVCPNCNGTGKITASILISDVIENNLDHIITQQQQKDLTLAVHPYLYAYFTKGLPSRRLKWFFKYFKWVNIEQDSSLGFIEYKFLDKYGEEIELTQQ